MARLFIFGIGGTGSRVLRALTMLLAGGADTNGYDIVPIIIDPDQANGNLTQNISLLDEYVAIRKYLSFTAGNKNRFFSTAIDDILTNFTMPVENTSNLKFKEFINVAGMSEKANKAMARMLFSDDNLNSDMNVGFKGNPNIGSVVLNQISTSEDFLSFAQAFQPNDKIFIISSIFGGTGASGFPLLLKTMRTDTTLPNHDAINNAEIGAITVLPYFKLTRDGNSSIDSATFISKSKSALAYYERNIANSKQINALYFIGDDNGNTYNNVEGGNQQANKAHAIELLAATAIIDFAQRSFTSRNNFLELGVEDAGGTLTINNFCNGLNHYIRRPLFQLAFTALGLEHDRSFLISKQLKKNTDLGLDDKFYEDVFVQKLTHFLSCYRDWLNEMKDNKVALNLFNMASSSEPFKFVTDVKAKSSVFSRNDWNTYRTALNKAKVTSSKKDDQLLEMYYVATEKLCKDKFNL